MKKQVFWRVCLFFSFGFLFFPFFLQAAPYAQGPEKCQKCHEAEYQVWQQTQHFKSFREINRNPKAKAILTASGGGPNIRANSTCLLCHFSSVQESPEAKPTVSSGISCESCHGASSNWLNLHNDYGGPNTKKETETPEHKTQRFADAHAAGWLDPTLKYDIASNCMTCHGFAHPSLDGEVINKMVAAGHPVNPEFELVRYSQGSVRHRFYPPDTTLNAEMSPAELARTFVTGQAAKLVSANAAKAKSTNTDYIAAQQKRIDYAAQVLSAVKSVAEAGALVAAPTEENARALVSAIADKDLSGEVAAFLPDKATYK